MGYEERTPTITNDPFFRRMKEESTPTSIVDAIIKDNNIMTLVSPHKILLLDPHEIGNLEGDLTSYDNGSYLLQRPNGTLNIYTPKYYRYFFISIFYEPINLIP